MRALIFIILIGIAQVAQAAQSGLCVLYDKEKTHGRPEAEASDQFFGDHSDCTPERAARLGHPVEYIDSTGKKKRYELYFLASEPLQNSSNCSMAQASVGMDGRFTLYDSSFRPETDDDMRAGIDTTTLNADPDFLQKAQISLVDALAIKDFMNTDFGSLNSALRSGHAESPRIAARIRLMAEGLNRIISVPELTVHGLVKRGVFATEAEINQWFPLGKCEIERGFTSASENDLSDARTSYGNQVIFIYSKTGARVHSLASNRPDGHQSEVIFRPGTVFRVRNNIADITGSSRKVILEECPCDD